MIVLVLRLWLIQYRPGDSISWKYCMICIVKAKNCPELAITILPVDLPQQQGVKLAFTSRDCHGSTATEQTLLLSNLLKEKKCLNILQFCV